MNPLNFRFVRLFFVTAFTLTAAVWAADSGGLRFEENRGQSHSSVDFQARGNGFVAFLSGDQLIMSLIADRAGSAMPDPHQLTGPRTVSAASTLRTQFVGARRDPAPTGIGALAGETIYNTTGGTTGGIRSFTRAAYHDLYPGIDLIYYGNQGNLEYDFVVAPGADPSAIELAFPGSPAPRLTASGDLELITPNGPVTQHAPITYQDIEGVRQTVASRYILTAENRVRIALGDYDRTRPLVIDPFLIYATFIGGGNFDRGIGVTRDPQGNVIVIGDTGSVDFPAGDNVFGPLESVNFKTFVQKYDATGQMLQWTALLDSGHTLDVDTDTEGNIYLVGGANSSAFPTTPGAFRRTFSRGEGYLVKLSPSGNTVFSTLFGGVEGDELFGVAVDGNGRAYVAGSTVSLQISGVEGSTRTGAASDVFVARFNSSGSSVDRFAYIQGSAGESIWAISRDASGSIYAVGGTSSPDLNVTPNALQPERNGPSDAFVARFDPDLNPIFITYIGGSQTESFYAALAYEGMNGAEGGVLLGGETNSNDYPGTEGTFNGAYKGGDGDGVVAKLSADGKTFAATLLSGTQDFERVSTLQMDYAGNPLVSGVTASLDFPRTPDAYGRGNLGNLDWFVTHLSADLSELLYSTYIGAQGEDYHWWGKSALDENGHLFLTGEIESAGFPRTQGAMQSQRDTPPDGVLFVAEVPTVVLPPDGPVITEVVDGGSFNPGISPYSWVTIRGENFTEPEVMRSWGDGDFIEGALPTALDGISATIDGNDAAVSYISDTQINVLSGAIQSAGQTEVTVTTPEGTATYMADVAPEAPAWFTYGPGEKRYLAAVNTEPSLNGIVIGPAGLYPEAPNLTAPVPAGGRAALYGTGFGSTDPMPPAGQLFSGAFPLADLDSLQITVGGSPAVIEFAGMVTPGLVQFNIIAPDLPPGDYEVIGTINGVSTQLGVCITIGEPVE